MQPTRIFIIEDHELVREALEHFIRREDELELAGASGTVSEGLAGIAETHPDVTLLDVYLPDGNGIELCRELKSTYPDIKCVVLTGAGEQPLVEAIVAGADGFVGKEVGFKELALTIGRVMAGERDLQGASPESILEMVQARAVAEKTPDLSGQQIRLLGLIGQGLTNKQIADELTLAEQTVKNYVSTLLSKLGLEHRTQAALYAVKFGYLKGDNEKS